MSGKKEDGLDGWCGGCCGCGCRHPALQLRAGLLLRPLAGERHPARLAGPAWGAAGAGGDLATAFLTYRLLLAVAAVALVAWSVSSVPSPTVKWFIYLTHWGVLAVAAHAVVACTLVFYLKFAGHPDHRDGLHWSSQVYWSVYNIAAPTALMISVFYWALLHGSSFDASPIGPGENDGNVEPELEPEMERSEASVALNIIVHAVNSVVMLIEVLLVALPSRLVHFYQPFVFGLMYVMFNAIYYFAGGTDYVGNPWVYAMIDWSNPGPTILVIILTTLLMAAMHALIVLLAILRDILVERYNGEMYIEKEINGHTNNAYKHDV